MMTGRKIGRWRRRDALWGRIWQIAGVDAAVTVAYVAVAIATLALFKTVAMWPAAGVAFAAAVLAGDRAWRGVFLGSILSNITWALMTGTHMFSSSSLEANVGIAVGNALAALAGGRALKASVGNRNP